MNESSSSTSKFNSGVWAMAAVPPLALALAALLLAAGVAGVRSSFWPPMSVNLAEAAALRDLASVRRLVEEGADPNTPLPIRPGIFSDEGQEMTPMEAARESGASDTLDLLRELGAR